MSSRSMFRVSAARRAAMTILCCMLVGTMGCSISPKPRNHWWEFWKTKQTPDSATIYYPDQQMLPPTPDSLDANKGGGSEGLPPPPGDMAEPGPLRTGASNSVSDLKTVYFAFDSDQLDTQAVATLDNDAAWLRQHSGYQIQLEGHTDDQGTVEYNLSLGDRRSKSVKAYLVSKGIPADSLHTITYGEERPIDTAENEAAWALNRRVQFLVY